MLNVLKKMIGKTVKRMFLIVWPPYREDSFSNIDISVGFELIEEPENIIVISTEKDGTEEPCIYYQNTPEKYFIWDEFEPRMKEWMAACEDEIDTEYYDVSMAKIFQNIVNNEILEIEIVEILNNSPLGIKIFFKHDFLLSTPIMDGNTIETSLFNKNDNIKNFKSIGAIIYKSIKKL